MARRNKSAYKKKFLADKVCVTCGTDKALTIDHIIARSLGGSDHPSNWQPMCWKDNQAKSKKESAFLRKSDPELTRILKNTRGVPLTKFTPEQLKILREHLWNKLTYPVNTRFFSPTGKYRYMRLKLEHQLYKVERELNRRFIFDWRRAVAEV